MDVLSLAVNLVDEREVEVEVFDPFPVKHSNLGLVFFILHVLDHIREPYSQPVVANTDKRHFTRLMLGKTSKQERDLPIATVKNDVFFLLLTG